jgi:hypothetical protein
MPSPDFSPPRVLIDIDVVLDVLARRMPFFTHSAAVLAACEVGRCQGMVAAHTITTLFYLLSKHHDSSFARVQLGNLLRIVNVATVDGDVIYSALTTRSADFEDAVQMAAAVTAAADYVVTRNLAHVRGGPITALTPSELLPLLRAVRD